MAQRKVQFPVQHGKQATTNYDILIIKPTDYLGSAVGKSMIKLGKRRLKVAGERHEVDEDDDDYFLAGLSKKTKL